MRWEKKFLKYVTYTKTNIIYQTVTQTYTVYRVCDHQVAITTELLIYNDFSSL